MSTSLLGQKSHPPSAPAQQQAIIPPTGKPKKPEKPIRFIVLDTWNGKFSVVFHRTGRAEPGNYRPKQASMKRLKTQLNSLIPLGWEMDIHLMPGNVSVYFFAPSGWFVRKEDKKCLVQVR